MSKATKHAVKQLQEQGHHVVIATGRAPFMYNELKKELNITTHIGFNGSYVVLDDQVVLAKSLDKDALKAIRSDAHEKGHPMVVMDHLGARTNIAASDRIRECMDSLHLPYPNVVNDPFEGEIYQGLLFFLKLKKHTATKIITHSSISYAGMNYRLILFRTVVQKLLALKKSCRPLTHRYERYDCVW